MACELVFHSEDETHCLFCDTPLRDASMADITRFNAPATFGEKAADTQAPLTHERMQNIAANYFRTTSFSFLYSLSRHEFKIGERFRRFLIQPVNPGFIIKLPWLIINVVDSVFFRLAYRGFCDRCQSKYHTLAAAGKHTQEECEYNQEYLALLNSILSGEIVRDESRFEQLAQQKTRLGKRSAYRDLYSRHKGAENSSDIITMLISVGLIVYLAARLVIPIFGVIYDF